MNREIYDVSPYVTPGGLVLNFPILLLDTSQTLQEFLTEASYCFQLHYFTIMKSLLYKQVSEVRIFYAVYGENMWGIGTTDGNPIVLEGQGAIFQPALNTRTFTEYKSSFRAQPLFSYLFTLFFTSKDTCFPAA